MTMASAVSRFNWMFAWVVEEFVATLCLVSDKQAENMCWGSIGHGKCCRTTGEAARCNWLHPDDVENIEVVFRLVCLNTA